MSLRRLPQIENLERPADDDEHYPGDAELKEWRNRMAVRLADQPAGTVIDILGPIGKNPFTGEGVNATDVTNILRKATGEVTVNVNSPGGSYFEGLAIYTLLANYKGKVTVNVIGTAASAASLVLCAGDVIRISVAGAVMVHNSQAGVMGDRHELEDGAAALGEIDAAIRTIYAARTGQTDAALDKMMTPTIGTWMFGQDAVDKGFADELIAAEKIVEDKSAKAKTSNGTRSARAELDAILSARGLSRSRRRELLRDAFPEKLTMPVENESGTEMFELAQALRCAVPERPVTLRADGQTTPGAGHLQALDKVGGLLANL